jgi:hypothetical protein
MSIYAELDNDENKFQPIYEQEMNQWFLERNEPEPKFLYTGDGVNDKRGQKFCWLLLDNNELKRGYIIISSKKNKKNFGFHINNKFFPYKIIEYGFMG